MCLKAALNECYLQEHIGSLKWHTHMQCGCDDMHDRKQTKYENEQKKLYSSSIAITPCNTDGYRETERERERERESVWALVTKCGVIT